MPRGSDHNRWCMRIAGRHAKRSAASSRTPKHIYAQARRPRHEAPRPGSPTLSSKLGAPWGARGVPWGPLGALAPLPKTKAILCVWAQPKTCMATRERHAWPRSRGLHGHTGEACMATRARSRDQCQGPGPRDQGLRTRVQGLGQGPRVQKGHGT